MMPTINTVMVFLEQPFHSFRMMPHTFENTTFSAIRIQNDRVMRVGDSVRKPFPRGNFKIENPRALENAWGFLVTYIINM
jgi:hypothetical protein